jgi:hypothetical protein
MVELRPNNIFNKYISGIVKIRSIIREKFISKRKNNQESTKGIKVNVRT